MNDKWNIKKVALYLIATVMVAYGLAAGLYFSAAKGSGFSKGLDYNIDNTKTAKLDGIKQISIEVPSANINIVSGNGNEASAHFYGRVTTSSKYEKPELSCNIEGDTLDIKIVNKSNFSIGFFSSNLKLDVSIPSAYTNGLKLVSSSGDIKLDNFKLSELNCHLSSGNLKINNISAENFIYENSSGNINAKELLTKTSSLRSSSGNINLEGYTGDLKGVSSSGDTNISYKSFDNSMDMHSSSGRVVVTLPESAQFYLNANASSGDVKCKFPITVTDSSKHNRLEGVVGSDKNRININCSSGDIEILK